MKASETNLLTFLSKLDQATVPIYQRPYSWGRPEWAQLLEDVSSVAQDDSDRTHFIGSVVLFGDTALVAGFKPAQIIDGQQRLTTVSLLLTALHRAAAAGQADSDEVLATKVRDRYLMNHLEDGDRRFKVVPSTDDRETYMRLLLGQPITGRAGRRLVEAVEFFELALSLPSTRPDFVLEGLKRLMIVEIGLERGRDDPQLIFESLNSTGLDLTQADLIRNFVLMGMPSSEQADVWRGLWRPIEERFAGLGIDVFDRFVRDVLSMKTGRICRLDQVYTEFRAHARTVAGGPIALLRELERLSVSYRSLVAGEATNPLIGRRLERIRRLKSEVTFPFLLDVLDDHAAGKINEEDVARTLDLVESFVVRRALCGMPTFGLNKVWAGMAREVDEDRYMESLQAALLLREGAGRFPADAEFRQELKTRDVYGSRICLYVLDRFENVNRKERVHTEDYTIEHVLPQNPDLSASWRTALGPDWREVHGRVLHTLGNLTLTGYNTELSDRPFTEKLTISGGFQSSPLRINSWIAGQTTWGEAEIAERGRQLADQACDLFPCPSVPEEILDGYRKARQRAGEVYVLDDLEALKGPLRPLFDDLRHRVLGLGTDVREFVRKHYVGYRENGTILTVFPQVGDLKIFLHATVEELDDPTGLSRDVRGVGHYGTGSTELRISGVENLDQVWPLIEQTYDRVSEVGGADTSTDQDAIGTVVANAVTGDARRGLLAIVDTAIDLGLSPRARTRTVMIAPPTNRTRALAGITVDANGGARAWYVPEAFNEFYSVDADTCLAAMGTSNQEIDTREQGERFAGGLWELLGGAKA